MNLLTHFLLDGQKPSLSPGKRNRLNCLRKTHRSKHLLTYFATVLPYLFDVRGQLFPFRRD
jgi:hypothetical protein